MYVDQAVRFELILQHLPPPPARIFEIGFGAGELLRHLAVNGYDVSGCETNANHVENLKRSNQVKDVLRANGSKLPVPDDCFDCTLSSDVFEHVLPSNRDNFLSEAFRITRPGGTLLMTVWLHDTWSFRIYGAIRLILGRTLPSWYIEHLTIPHPSFEHVHRFFLEHTCDVKINRYQGPLNLAVMTLQHVAAAKWKFRVARKMGCLLPVAKHCDWLGRKTSCLFVGLKK